MKPRLALYPGSFDPFTNGHLDILGRALRIFDRVEIVIAVNSRKGAAQSAMLSPAERAELIRAAVSERGWGDRVTLSEWSGLIMECARARGASAVVRGLRAASDFEYEFTMASMNSQLNPEVESVFLMTSQAHHFVSSSLIKELFAHGGDISPYVPAPVLKFLQNRGKKS
jgi:pantetheine-phosphate adenylyltransferase